VQHYIQDPLERRLVATADAGLSMVAALRRPFQAQTAAVVAPRRILLLRLERIGDLVMALPAIRDVRALAPDAQIDLVVGSWNATLARAVPNVDRVETLDARWLAREREGLALGAMLRTAWTWRTRRYDLAINFEPDIRSNLVLAAAGARSTAGWRSGGGGPILAVALDYDTRAHTTANARRLVAEAFGTRAPESARPLLTVPDAAAAAAASRIRTAPGGQAPLVGIHVSGGRAIKQWDPGRFAEVARRLIETRGAAIVATGSAGDRPLVDDLRRALAPHPVIDVTGADDLLDAAAVLARLDVLVTGDTGPMHLASAVGTPVVAVFGPSDPIRYATAGPLDRVVRIELACSPCNRIRQPPARCVGHTPDCLAGIDAGAVYDAAAAVLDATRARLPRAGRS
jgi:lipopolysaccharide heptosyltransferase II